MLVKCVVNIMPTKLFGFFNKGTLRMGVLTSPCLYVCPSMFVRRQFEKSRHVLITLYIKEFYYNISIVSYIRCLDRPVSKVNRLRTGQQRNISFLGRRRSKMRSDRTCSHSAPCSTETVVPLFRNKACSSTNTERRG
jgi:hypothetical protein